VIVGQCCFEAESAVANSRDRSAQDSSTFGHKQNSIPWHKLPNVCRIAWTTPNCSCR